VLAESLNISTPSSSTDNDTSTIAQQHVTRSNQRLAQPNMFENLASGRSNQISFDLANVLEMSRREEERREQLRKQEDEELELILRLSLFKK